MNSQEHFLTCLAEECSEVAQRISKALRFSLNEVQPGQSLNNAQRISGELKDLNAIAGYLDMLGVIPGFLPSDDEAQAKIEKIFKFMKLVRDQGALGDLPYGHII